MNTNSIAFSGDGPIMSGTWINPSNGDTFTVKDSFFQDNQYMVQTTDGRLLDYNFIQHYVQADEQSLKALQESKQKTESNTIKNIPPEVSSLLSTNDEATTQDNYNQYMLEEDLILTTPKKNQPQVSLGNLNQNTQNIPQSDFSGSTEMNPNTLIISKALQNTEKPDVNIKFSWAKCPIEKINALNDLFGIPNEEIIDWYIENMDKDVLYKSIIDEYKTNLNNFLNKKSKAPTPTEQQKVVSKTNKPKKTISKNNSK